MHDPFAWAFSIGRWFGITIRVHYLFPLVILPLIYNADVFKTAPAGTWIDALTVVFLIFFIVLFHEIGHCLGARYVGGEADDVLMWPLGGLAQATYVPQNPRAYFLFAAAGPLVNALICLVTGLVLSLAISPGIVPPWKFWQGIAFRSDPTTYHLATWNGEPFATTSFSLMILYWTFDISWFLLLFNVCLVGLPFDGGAMGRALLWPKVGFATATKYMYTSGFVISAILLASCFFWKEPFFLAMSIFAFTMCWREMHLLETLGEESLFGYDFSQGYTSLERDNPKPPARKKQNFIQRWIQQRAERKLKRELEHRQAEETRMDQLLEKIQQSGKDSLTDEETRFLKRVADRFRHRR